MQISKLKKKKTFYSILKKAENPIELVHTDVVGKLETSYLGYNYYVSFLDDYSHKVLVFTTKDNDIKKVRLVARRFQIPGQDFMETYSPIVQADSLRLTITIALNLNWNFKQLDIKTTC